MKSIFTSKSLVALVLGVFLVVGWFVAQQTAVSSQWNYEDGTYRGVFIDRNEVQVNIQFTLEDNVITNVRFRHLAYGGIDYLDTEHDTFSGLTKQYQALIDSLIDQDIRVSLNDLYEPGTIVSDEYDIDGFTGATIRGNKVISAARDALNRGVYSY